MLERGRREPVPADLWIEVRVDVDETWGQRQPRSVDLAGGETRDTVTELMDLLCGHPDIDAVLHLGLGIQSGQANAFKSGPFYPDHGLERISAFHEAQDRRYGAAAREASERHGVPVLSASELVYADRDYGNAGPVGVREEGRVCYPSAQRAVGALRALVEWAEFRRRS